MRATRLRCGTPTTMSPRITKAAKKRLDEMIEEATVDAYGEEEQALGFSVMLEQNLALPFETEMLGITVVVERIELSARNEIVAVCRRGHERQSVPLLDLPLPKRRPRGAEWIDAYRQWVGV